MPHYRRGRFAPSSRPEHRIITDRANSVNLKIDVPILSAHRGTSIMAPENTAPAFEFGYRHGATVLETDVRVSADGQVIVIHDASVDRTSDGSGAVRALTLAQIKKLDAGYRHRIDGKLSHRATGVRFLTLRELLLLYPDRIINIDIKDNSLEAADTVLEVVGTADAFDRCVLASFHDRILLHVRERCPRATTSAGMREVSRFFWRYASWQAPPPVTAGVFQLPVSYFRIPLTGRRFIRRVHASGIPVHYWTINSTRQARWLVERGAGGIVTDRADQLAEFFPPPPPLAIFTK